MAWLRNFFRSEIGIAAVGATVILIVALAVFSQSMTPRLIVPSNSTSVAILDARPLFSNVLLSTTAVLGSVFAVAFGFSQFFISMIADKYSPRMLKSFRKSRRYQAAYLLIFLSTIASVSSLLSMDVLGQTLLYLIAAVITVVFAISLFAFLLYYDYIYQVVDPMSFSLSVEKQIRSSLHDTVYTHDASTALADSAIKATNRGGEEENVAAFVNSLASVAIESIKSQGRNGAENLLFNHVMESLLRIQETALTKGDEKVTFLVSLKVREIKVALDGSS